MSGTGMNGAHLRDLASDALRRWPRLRVALRRADRQLGRQVAQLKGTMRAPAPRRLFRAALPAGSSIQARFVGVLDGHTLNLDLEVPPALAADVVGAELHLVRGVRGSPCPLTCVTPVTVWPCPPPSCSALGRAAWTYPRVARGGWSAAWSARRVGETPSGWSEARPNELLAPPCLPHPVPTRDTGTGR